MDGGQGGPSSAPMLDALFSHLPVDGAAKANLLAGFTNGGRCYHDVSHLSTLWSCHERHAAGAALDSIDVQRRIACAIAFHDAVYDSRRGDNEEMSASAWLLVATRCRVDPKEAIWVAETIRATKSHLAYTSADMDDPDERLRLWFLDLDLAPLAEAPENFRRNAQRLRHEFTHLTDTAWAEANLAFLHKLSEAPRIFRSPVLFATYELRARANILAAIARHGQP